MKEIIFNNRKIGDGNKTFFVCEAGATHTGLQSAKNLVDIAIKASFDAVKFQIVESAKCPHPDELFNGFKCIDIWKQRELTQDEWKELKEYCNQKGIFSFTTITDVNQLDWFPSETYKIRSRDIENFPLINAVAEKCNVIQLDTGNASFQQINQATINEREIILHHCPTGYPAKSENENLLKIRQYKEYFKCPVAYSAHSGTPYLYAMAMAMGANMIEIPIMESLSVSLAPEVLYALSSNAKDYILELKELEKCL